MLLEYSQSAKLLVRAVAIHHFAAHEILPRNVTEGQRTAPKFVVDYMTYFARGGFKRDCPITRREISNEKWIKN